MRKVESFWFRLRCLGVASACLLLTLPLGIFDLVATAQQPTVSAPSPGMPRLNRRADDQAVEVPVPDSSRPRRLTPPDADLVIPGPSPAADDPTNPARASSSRVNEHYRIGPGDFLDVRVFNRPQLSDNNVRVNNDGSVKLPFIDAVPAACRTEDELAQEIRTRLLKYQRNPQVNVIVKQVNAQPVTVLGAVNSPALFQLQRQVRLQELLLAHARGPSTSAGRTVQILHIETPISMCEEPAAPAAAAAKTASEDEMFGLVTYDLIDTLKGIEQANPYVRPGDIITVLEAERIYMLGGVNSPGPIPLTLREPLTISHAVVLAGGIASGSEPSKVQILRQPPGSATKEKLVVNLNKIKKNEADDIALLANDIVEVPGVGGFKKAIREFKNTFIPTLTQSLPYRIIY